MKNHKAIVAAILAATLCAASPLLASAIERPSSDSSSSSTRSDPAPAPVERSDPAPAPVERSDPAPAPVERSDPAPPPVEHSDPAPVERTAPEPAAPSAPTPRGEAQPLPRPPARSPVQPLPPYQARVPSRPNTSGGSKPVQHPHERSSSSAWDDSIASQDVQTYWGDGFWGPLAAGLAASAYVVASGSPGAQLLQTYGLTQTPCGPPNLVEIFGPSDSEICAFPNDLVAPGAYHVDTQTLQLISSVDLAP